VVAENCLLLFRKIGAGKVRESEQQEIRIPGYAQTSRISGHQRSSTVRCPAEKNQPDILISW